MPTGIKKCFTSDWKKKRATERWLFFALDLMGEDQRIAAFSAHRNHCTNNRLIGLQCAFASQLNSYNGGEYIRGRLVGCQAAFADKPRSYKSRIKSRAAYTHPLLTTH